MCYEVDLTGIMVKVNRKLAVGVIGVIAVVATPAIAQAGNLTGQTNFTTATASALESNRYTRVGAIRVCGDIQYSSTYAQYIMQIRRDLQFSPDPVTAQANSTYNAGYACSSYGSGVEGNTYYSRGVWQVAENPAHNGFFVANV